MKKWANVELDKGRESDAFRAYLIDKGVVYEASEAWNMIHFEFEMSDDDMQEAAEVLDVIVGR